MILINIFDKSLDLTFSYSIVVDSITLNILFISKSFAPCYLHLRNMFINTDYNSSCFIADIFKNITQCIKYIFLCAIYNNGYRYGYSKWLFFFAQTCSQQSPIHILVVFYLKYISKTFLYNSLKLSNTRVVSADQTPDFEIQNPKYLCRSFVTCPMQSEVRLNKRYRLMPILGLS